MKLRILFVLACLVAALALAFNAGVWASQQRVPGKAETVWDYRVVVEPTPGSGAVLGAQGAEGWDLVAVTTQDEYSGNTRSTKVYYYLKRERRTY